MPNIEYDNDQTTTFVSKPRFKFSLPSLNLRFLWRLILISATTALVGLLSAFVAGFIMALGGNITVVNLDIIFDAQITVAYIATYYFLSHFYGLTKNQMYYFFLLALLLSFSLNFIQGSVLLVLLPPILRKFKLISTQA